MQVIPAHCYKGMDRYLHVSKSRSSIYSPFIAENTGGFLSEPCKQWVPCQTCRVTVGARDPTIAPSRHDDVYSKLDRQPALLMSQHTRGAKRTKSHGGERNGLNLVYWSQPSPDRVASRLVAFLKDLLLYVYNGSINHLLQSNIFACGGLWFTLLWR